MISAPKKVYCVREDGDNEDGYWAYYEKLEDIESTDAIVHVFAYAETKQLTVRRSLRAIKEVEETE